MRRHRRFLITALLLLAALSVSYSTASAQKSSNGFEAIAKHLKTRYQARKKSIPFMGLAKFAVRLVKPAGVKSISVSIFENLQGTGELLGAELNGVMRNALSPEWLPLVTFRRKGGDQVYVYATDEGKDLKLAVLSINQSNAVLARVKIDPNALRKFLDNPSILGISLGDGGEQQALQPREDETGK